MPKERSVIPIRIHTAPMSSAVSICQRRASQVATGAKKAKLSKGSVVNKPDAELLSDKSCSMRSIKGAIPTTGPLKQRASNMINASNKRVSRRM